MNVSNLTQDAHATPFMQALRTQLRFVARLYRPQLIAAAVGGAVVFLLAAFAVRIPVLHGQSADGGGANIRFTWFSEADFGLPDAAGLVAVFAAYGLLIIGAMVWGGIIWSSEPPCSRGYLWRLPISRFQGQLARVAAGGIFLMAAIVVFVIAVIAGLAAGGRLGVIDFMPWTSMVSIVTGPVTAYLLTSIPFIGWNHGGKIFLGFFFGINLFGLLVGGLKITFLYRLFDQIVDGSYGYGVALMEGFAAGVSGGTPGGGQWLISALLWLSISLAGVIWVTRRYREN